MDKSKIAYLEVRTYDRQLVPWSIHYKGVMWFNGREVEEKLSFVLNEKQAEEASKHEKSREEDFGFDRDLMFNWEAGMTTYAFTDLGELRKAAIKIFEEILTSKGALVLLQGDHSYYSPMRCLAVLDPTKREAMAGINALIDEVEAMNEPEYEEKFDDIGRKYQELLRSIV